MKKAIFAAMAVALVFAAVSCGTKPITQQDPEDPVSRFIRETRRNVPADALLGIGTSTHTNRGLARSTAETRARAEIARQVNVVVRNMGTDYVASSEADQQALLTFQESVTQTLAEQSQSGAIIADETVVNGEQITIVMLTKDALERGLLSASQAAAALAPNANAALWAVDRMEQALAEQNALPPTIVRD